jgi:hypothetical protein
MDLEVAARSPVSPAGTEAAGGRGGPGLPAGAGTVQAAATALAGRGGPRWPEAANGRRVCDSSISTRLSLAPPGARPAGHGGRDRLGVRQGATRPRSTAGAGGLRACAGGEDQEHDGGHRTTEAKGPGQRSMKRQGHRVGGWAGWWRRRQGTHRRAGHGLGDPRWHRRPGEERDEHEDDQPGQERDEQPDGQIGGRARRHRDHPLAVGIHNPPRPQHPTWTGPDVDKADTVAFPESGVKPPAQPHRDQVAVLELDGEAQLAPAPRPVDLWP